MSEIIPATLDLNPEETTPAKPNNELDDYQLQQSFFTKQ